MLIDADSNYCSTICPNRVANGFLDWRCSIPCGEGTFTGNDGRCYSCNEEKNINVSGVTHEGCEQCDNRKQYGNSCVLSCDLNNFRGNDGKCYSCDYPDPIDADLDWRCSIPCEKGSFTGSNGRCYSCDEEKNIDTNAVKHHGCEQCPDTRNLYNNRFCVPKCSGDTPLRGSDNKCYPCDTETRVAVTNMTDACYECSDQRKLDGNYCVLK